MGERNEESRSLTVAARKDASARSGTKAMMNAFTYIRRALAWHWRVQLATALAIGAATATLTGSLLVGDSMRGSLRALALERLSGIEATLAAPRFFRTELADSLGARLAADAGAADARVHAALLASGAAERPDGAARCNRVDVFGLPGGVTALAENAPHDGASGAGGRAVVLSDRLARELRAGVGDDVLLRVAHRGDIPAESLLGRRDDLVRTLRLTVSRVMPPGAPGDLSLQGRQEQPANAFVDLDVLARALSRGGTANAILIRRGERAGGASIASAAQGALRVEATPADLGVRLRNVGGRFPIVLESDSLLLAPPLEEAARRAAEAAELEAHPVLTYLANEIAVALGGANAPSSGSEATSSAAIPYSTVCGVDDALWRFWAQAGEPGCAVPLKPGDIALNDWAARRLGAKLGDRLRLRYYVTGPFGRLDERDAWFTLKSIVSIDGVAGDPTLTPDYPGVTDADRISDWDPPFPVDFRRIGPEDDEYWERHRATPKAFVSLEDAERLWADQPERYGRYTALRLRPRENGELAERANAFQRELMERLDPGAAGLSFAPVREQALAAARGSTDFGGLFIGFSLFLIVAAGMLVVLLSRLGVERRAGEIGLLLAVGVSPRRMQRLILLEHAAVSVLGAGLGVCAAGGYAWLLVAGLRGWWSAAASAPFLRLHVAGGTLAAGLACGTLLGIVAAFAAARRLSRRSARGLLAGEVGVASLSSRRGGSAAMCAVAGAFALGAAGIAAAAARGGISESAGFFGAAACAVVFCLLAAREALHRSAVAGSDVRAFTLAALAARNAARQPGRSMLTVGMLACATFLIVSLGAFRLRPADTNEKVSGSGGFTYFAESAIPILEDANRRIGDVESGAALAGVRVYPMRLRPGDAGSCTNLQRPRDPRLLGAPREFVERGGFRFSGVMSGVTGPAAANPWTLLEATPADGAIPVIGDEASVRWQYHLGLGEELTIQDERGRPATLRFVALLSGSFLQDELIVSEEAFSRLFPSRAGYSFFAVQSPNSAEGVESALEQRFADVALDAAPVADRLRRYVAVQNTYLLTFQQLGGIGLAFGGVALLAITARNVWERRREVALMHALGFTRARVRAALVVETSLLVAGGLAAGAIPALLAVLPALRDRPGELPWTWLVGAIATTGAIGLGGCVAVLRTLREDGLVAALRSE